ncbi:MFS transporter [Gordonibacter massiliensis (ex Traore et al. 2017)]|uniref:MFS transporter n=1 Tax=Gordonibacter massiliensis (ex Traore et al. 2017) TaxID=1841863 RepID=A0A842JK65_9ACTN|nr:MFS transporter [Gordonibacter massiliensis (ex Traore et al. 2017)]MBC2890198.1 MFS transporter [Gordonibacter massiliensis (ex Traore et al. 2017)]
MDARKSSGTGWVVTLVGILAAVAIAINMFKVPPTMGLLMADLGIGPALGGWLMTVPTITGLILALPSGGLTDKFGPKKVGLFAILSAAVGSLLGTFSPTIELLLVSRFVEGLSFALIGVAVPALISMWFSPEKSGAPMTIWSGWVPIGMLAIFTGANLFISADDPGTWTNVWWVSTALLAVAAVLYLIFVKAPAGYAAEKAPKISLVAGMKSPSTWLLALIFAMFAFIMYAVSTFAPTYCMQELGYSIEDSNLYSSLITVGMIVGVVLMTPVLNKVVKLKSRIWLLVASMVLTALIAVLAFNVPPSATVAVMVVTGIVLQLVPAVIWPIAPSAAVAPIYIGTTFGVIALGRSIGGFGNASIGTLIETSGWGAAIVLLVGIGVVGVVACLALLKFLKDPADAPAPANASAGEEEAAGR